MGNKRRTSKTETREEKRRKRVQTEVLKRRFY